MYEFPLAHVVNFVLCFVVAGFLLHVISSAIIDRITDRSNWPPLFEHDDDNDLTNDTGPK